MSGVAPRSEKDVVWYIPEGFETVSPATCPDSEPAALRAPEAAIFSPFTCCVV